MSRGRYVAFLDDDDVWLPEKLLRQTHTLEAHPKAAVVYSPYLIRFPGGGELLSCDENAPSGWIFQELLREGNYCGGPISSVVRPAAFHAAGGFDEGLPTGEDYDLWLRLASRFPILFVPGPVAVKQPSLEGKYARHLVDGDASNGLSTRYIMERRIVESALGLLPRTEASAAFTREVLAALETRIAGALCDYRCFDLMRAQLIGGFRRAPWLVHYASPRVSMALVWGRFAKTVDEPIPTTTVFCDELKHVARGYGLKHWAQMRRLRGGIWKELGIQLAAAGRQKEAAHAARRVTASFNPP